MDAERVTRSVELDAAPAEVWDALTEDALLGEWLADEVELEAEPGGEIVCRYADGEERRGEVELVEEAERLAWSWRREGGAPSRVELVLDAVADRHPPDGDRDRALRDCPSAAGRCRSAPPRLARGTAWGPPLARLRAAVRLVLA